MLVRLLYASRAAKSVNSEALALMWSDMKEGVVRVQRSLVGTRFDTTKTERVRAVPIDDALVEALRRVRKAQLASGINNSLGLVFTRTGAPLDLQLLRRRNFARIVKRAGLDPRRHGLCPPARQARRHQTRGRPRWLVALTGPDKTGTGTSKTRGQSPFCRGL